jgi:hypothetical protein
MPKNTINFTALDHAQWPVQNVQAFATSRIYPFKGQESKQYGAYDDFNLGDHVGDIKAKVLNNRDQLQKLLPKNTTIQWLTQVHSSDVLSVSHYSSAPLTADAMITSQKNIALAIMTADCLPILLSDQQGKTIAAIHGGWRPLSLNIIEKTVNRMRIPGEKIYAWLGPCIGKNTFEVGAAVRAVFVKQNAKFASAFALISAYNNVEQKYLADLHKIAIIQLKNCAITKIYALPNCTVSMPERYYSYRRDKKTGRMATIITRV